MPTVEKILEEMRRNPRNVRFNDLLKVAECFFGEPRVHGSHYRFTAKGINDPRINIQNDHGKAKPYQVRQVLAAIDELEKREGHDA